MFFQKHIDLCSIYPNEYNQHLKIEDKHILISGRPLGPLILLGADSLESSHLLMIEGTKEERTAQLRDVKSGNFNVVVTSFEFVSLATVTRDFSRFIILTCSPCPCHEWIIDCHEWIIDWDRHSERCVVDGVNIVRR
jgi:hypothetical protein